MQRLKKLLLNFLTATKLAFIGRWNSWKPKRKNIIHLDAAVFAELVRSKDEFIVYLQDDIARLNALNSEKSIERVVAPVEYRSSRGYKSVHTKIRENIIGARMRHTPIEEKDYDRVNVNDSTD